MKKLILISAVIIGLSAGFISYVKHHVDSQTEKQFDRLRVTVQGGPAEGVIE